jgi:hypothetical protein
VSAAMKARPGPVARIGRVIAIVLVFVALAPPLGALIWVALLVGTGLPPEWEATEVDRHWVTALGLIYAVPMSYYFGAAPAAAGGLVIGFWQSFVGRAGWPLALGTGLVVAIAVLDRSGQGALVATPGESPFPEYPAVVILACLIPILLCWGLVRGWYVAPTLPTGAAP